jgi:ribosome-associated heat shock protein Hsp15
MSETMRLDRFLWFARLAKTRDVAQAMACDGHLRIDGRAIDRAHAPVRIGNILTFVHQREVRVLRVEALPARRGPAPEAQACYQELSAGGDI